MGGLKSDCVALLIIKKNISRECEVLSLARLKLNIVFLEMLSP